MKVSILTDNNPGGKTGAEHGLSYFIEHDGTKILFDTGQSDLFLQNASIMGINLEERGLIILSHGHHDHGNGLAHLSGGRLLCHPDCFVKRYRTVDHTYIGLKNSRSEIAEKFDLTTSKAPFSVSDSILFLGEIPRITDFESQQTAFSFEDGTPDFVADDSAVALQTDKGLFVITGCGHAGVVNTLEHATKATGEQRIFGIMGGFHLKKRDRQTIETIHYLKKNRVEHVIPSHCTALPAIVAFKESIPIQLVKTGDMLTF
ncbi:MAG: MBL fold metallo-hydrolase [Bacteroidales bacterium]|jgi:7,8-dihydropterin-6-yl-methyl-4-(beta-D-ribofuranosyl)aminobenzene 5'-phosphate synthase|nr:MBL fold metallo-hydrolase [Bacteroidales bacterium]MDD3105651.1 MBL fold metallo-hydrolase [Bacteroidales bacterium]MDD3550191.1 MBL fold metallo-hydrolase [Bacteroidales bacterium]MDD3980024.1 MBL fold metallo-hydrolase [Proteiniphilum sp.]MDY0183525.1 MBL fold metallo-hydrolase [Proteiniphilum sp.]